jgi:hypothetical protein
MEGVTKKLSFAFGTAFNFSVDADEGETQRQARADLEVGDNTNNFPAVEIIDYKNSLPLSTISPIKETTGKNTVDTSFNFNVDADEGETHRQARVNFEVTQVNNQKNFLSSPFIFPMEGTKKKTGGFVRAFCNYNTPFSVASTSTQSAQDENENNATYKSCDNDFHTMSKAFNFMNPNSRGNPYNIPPKWLDDEPVPDSISPIPMNFRVQGEPLQDPPTGARRRSESEGR